MSDTILCPVCETPNTPDATHCEVCGERLAPPQPGEEISPEENVSAMLAAQAEEQAAQAAAAETPASDTVIPEDVSAGFDMGDDDEYELPADTGSGDVMGIDPVDAPVSFHGEDTPDVLYSPMTGAAYERGTPEYEEGFGPMGDQLVATPPSLDPNEPVSVPGQDEAPASFDADFDDEPVLQGTTEHVAEEALSSFDDEDDLDEGFAPEGSDAPRDAAVERDEQVSIETPNPFRVSGPNPAVVLPKPGTYETPASVTLYHQKQPVLTQNIETDETLIGRKDIRADIYPDIDLSPYDPESFVSRKHAYIYRQNKNYTLYAISNGGVQLNSDLLDLGERRQIKDGDVIVIAGFLAFKFSTGG